MARGYVRTLVGQSAFTVIILDKCRDAQKPSNLLLITQLVGGSDNGRDRKWEYAPFRVPRRYVYVQAVLYVLVDRTRQPNWEQL